MDPKVTWANATFTYEVSLAEGEFLKGATIGMDIGPERVQPGFEGSDIECDLERVFRLRTTNGDLAPKIFWADSIFGADGDARLLLEDRKGALHDIALIQVTEDEVWIARSEPTLDNRLGITVANEENKVLLLGLGDLIEVDLEPTTPELPPKKGHQLIVTLHESYKWKHASPSGCGHTTGSVRTTSPAAFPDYSAPDGGTCFAAGTPVMLAGNLTKPIDTLRLDDPVLARDPQTGKVGTRRIKHVLMHNVESTLVLQLANGEQIETTPKHHFAVEDSGFTAASGLDVGRRLIATTQRNVEVAELTPVTEPRVVYNLEVEEFHTYFVGRAGTWVHNAKKD
jgi:hypothetical protein